MNDFTNKRLIFLSCFLGSLISLFSQFPFIRKGLDASEIGLQHHIYQRYDIIRELDSLPKILENVHPNIYHSRSKAEIEAIFAETKAKLPPTLKRNEYYALFTSLLSEYRDGHIGALAIKPGLYGIPQNFLDDGKLFPFQLYQLENEVFVTTVWSSKSPIEKGDIILKINGYNADSLFNICRKSFTGNTRYQHYYAGKEFRFLLKLLNIESPFQIQYRCTKDGTIKEAKEKGIENRFIDLQDLRGGKGRFKYIDSCSYFSLSILSDSIAYIKFHTFMGNAPISFFGISISQDELKTHLDKSFKILQERGIKKMVVDMRDNTGGYVKNIDYLLYYLTVNDYPLIRKVGVKASHEYGRTYVGLDKKNIKMKWFNHCEKQKILIPIDSFYYTTCMKDTLQHAPNPYLFNGRTCMLIGPGTFSAANLAANIVQQNKVATLIGEATDEMVNDYGNPVLFYFRRTGITFYIPTTAVFAPGVEDNEKRAVLPDIVVKPNRDKLAKGEDIVLEKAIEWLTQNL